MFLWLILNASILGAVFYIFHLYRNRQTYFSSWHLPGPRWLPIFGNALKFFCKNEDLFEEATKICNSYPSPMRFWFGTKMAVIITDVHHAEKIMSSMKFATKDDLYKFIEPFNGKGLITSSGVKWKRDRRLMAPLFLKKNSMHYFRGVLNHTKILIDILDRNVGESTFNVYPFIHKCVADCVNETMMGVKTNIQFGELEEFIESIKSAYMLCYLRMVKVWLQNDFLFRISPYWNKYQTASRHIHDFFSRALKVAETKHTYSMNNTSPFRPILDQLIDIRRELPDFATDEEMIHHLITLYTASEDTVTLMTSFSLVLLGMYPVVQNKVVEEIENVLGRNKRDVEEYDLPKLEYLDMVLKEVLRLFPIAPFIVRKSLEEFNLDGKVIPEDCSIIVSIYNIHRDTRYWEKPNEFYPDHFLPEAVQQRHPYAFMPFSAGPRGCLGKPYAYMAMKILLVTILQSFRIEADGKLEDIKLKQDISVRVKDDVYPIRLFRR